MMPSSADPSWFEIRRYRPLRRGPDPALLVAALLLACLVTGVALMALGKPINPAVDASYFVT